MKLSSVQRDNFSNAVSEPGTFIPMVDLDPDGSFVERYMYLVNGAIEIILLCSVVTFVTWLFTLLSDKHSRSYW